MIIVENYDGEKGYIDDDKFNAVELDERIYLLPEFTFNVPPCDIEDGSGDITVYRVTGVPDVNLNCVEAVRIRGKRTLAKLVQKRTEDLEKIGREL